MTREELIKRFTTVSPITHYAESTMRRYKPWFMKFMDSVVFDDSSELTVFDAQDYLLSLMDEETERRAYNHAVYSLRYLYNVVLGLNISEKAIPAWKAPGKEKPNFTPEQAQALLFNCPDLRLKAVIALGAGCGLRISEVHKLRFRNIQKKAKIISIENSKGQKSRDIPYPDSVAGVLNEYCRTARLNWNDPDAFVFPGKKPGRPLTTSVSSTAFRNYIQAFPFVIPGHSFHSLRHAFASFLSMKGFPLSRIQKLLGHSSITTTAKYIHTPEDTTQLPDIFNPDDDKKKGSE